MELLIEKSCPAWGEPLDGVEAAILANSGNRAAACSEVIRPAIAAS